MEIVHQTRVHRTPIVRSVHLYSNVVGVEPVISALPLIQMMVPLLPPVLMEHFIKIVSECAAVNTAAIIALMDSIVVGVGRRQNV